MAEKTNIAWTHHTASPWLGCSQVSAACKHCYAMTLAEGRLEGIFRRAYKNAGFKDWETRPVWGNNATRILTKSFWKDVYAWNRKAKANGKREFIFTSQIDWLDVMPAGIIDQDGNKLDPNKVLADFLKVVHECDWLVWQLLTKRPELWVDRILAAMDTLPEGTLKDDLLTWHDYDAPWPNVWIGATIEDRDQLLRRNVDLMAIPAVIHFWSAEPLLGDIGTVGNLPDWIICGGESGKGFREMDLAWTQRLADQCAMAKRYFFMKQDSNMLAGQRGRLSDELWSLKQVPPYKEFPV